MDEFDGLDNSGAKAMRETIDRKNDEIAKLTAELTNHKDEKLKDAVKQIGLNPESGFGNIISKGSTKDAIRAKLTLMENAKNES